LSQCQLELSGFADETSESKLLAEQLAVIAALGLRYLTLRFVDAGNGIKNILQLDDREVDFVISELDRYGLRVSSLGSPLGKVKLFEFEDESPNQFVEPSDYLDNHVEKACRLATRIGTRLIRGFSFYHPRGQDPKQFVSAAADRLKAIVEVCDAYGLTYGIEVEANLVGQNAELLMEIHRNVAHDALVLIFDGANLVTQGFTRAEIVEQFQIMIPALGWLHVKDYRANPNTERPSYVDEEALDQFVPAGEGDAGYPDILPILIENFTAIQSRMHKRGVSCIFADLEPHLRAGGQFAGFSGPDGFGIATRAFVALCEKAGVRCDVTSFEDAQRRNS